MKITQKIESNFYGEREIFLNEKGDQFSRISCGIGWPTGHRAGFAVALGESLFKDRAMKKSHYYVLGEHENFNPTDLLKKCLIWQREIYVGKFYADTKNEPMLEFLRKLNIGLYLTDPPHNDDPNSLSAYISNIRECTTRLHLGGSGLQKRLWEIPADKIKRATSAGEFPLLMALGGCLSALITWEHDPQEQHRANVLNEELEDLEDYIDY